MMIHDECATSMCVKMEKYLNVLRPWLISSVSQITRRLLFDAHRGWMLYSEGSTSNTPKRVYPLHLLNRVSVQHAYINVCTHKTCMKQQQQQQNRTLVNFFVSSVHRRGCFLLPRSQTQYIWMNINIFNNFVFFPALSLSQPCSVAFSAPNQPIYVKYYFGSWFSSSSVL